MGSPLGQFLFGLTHGRFFFQPPYVISKQSVGVRREGGVTLAFVASAGGRGAAESLQPTVALRPKASYLYIYVIATVG